MNELLNDFNKDMIHFLESTKPVKNYGRPKLNEWIKIPDHITDLLTSLKEVKEVKADD